MGKVLTTSLSLFTLLLGIVIGIEIMLWHPLDSNKASAIYTHSITTTHFQESEVPPVIRLPSLRLYREITERSLFSKQRRPLNINHSGDHKKVFPKELVLQGIYSTSDKRIAVLFDNQKNKKFYLSINQQLSGWRVIKITAWGLTLAKGPYQKILHLKDAKDNQATNQQQPNLSP